jgi:hypothetical protein
MRYPGHKLKPTPASADPLQTNLIQSPPSRSFSNVDVVGWWFQGVVVIEARKLRETANTKS